MLEPAKVETSWPRSDAERYRDRRMYERFSLDGAFGNLIYKGALLPCQFIDISLGGCCVRTVNPFADGSLAPVEVVLLIFGLVLRIAGVTQWTSRGNLVGIHFMHPAARSKNQLAALLTCLIDRSAADALQEAVAEGALDQPDAPILAEQAPKPAAQRAYEDAARQGGKAAHAAHPHQAADSGPKPQLPLETEWPAVVRFLESKSHVQCLIVDLKPEGCTVETVAPFPGGRQSRVELSFHMRGLPFQLAGVTAAFLDKCTADVRFMEMSRRKREELGQVLEELLQEKKQAAEAAT